MKELIKMSNISKAFPGVQALKDVSFDVRSGEAHALVGENGAGKSTLIKILMGVYTKDEGQVLNEGIPVHYDTPIAAKKLGLGAVYQDITLIQHLSVGENFFLGNLPLNHLGLIDWNKIYSVSKQAIEDIGLKINPRSRVMDLTVAQQEMITIAKVVYEKARIIVFDEPTALLTNEEVDELYRIIKILKERGYGIIYISHRLEEIFDICDRVTVLKDGKYVNTIETAETNKDQLISMMVGRSLEDIYNIEHQTIGEPVLSVHDLCDKRGRFKNVSFDLHRGEILGFCGLVGSGRTDIMRCIFGADPVLSGEIYINGRKAMIKKPIDAIRQGIGFVTEDRRRQGLMLQLSVAFNINIASYDLISKRGFGLISLKKEKNRAQRSVSELRIKTPTVNQLVQNLSGGNQQKVVISKWMNRDSKIFIFDEPTVGVDVGAKLEIYKLFEAIVARGDSIIVVSSYLNECIGLADRIITVYEGKITGEINRCDFSDEKVMRQASGLAD